MAPLSDQEGLLPPGEARTCGSSRRAAACSSLQLLAKPLVCSRSLTQLPLCVSWEDVGPAPGSTASSVPSLLLASGCV